MDYCDNDFNEDAKTAFSSNLTTPDKYESINKYDNTFDYTYN